MKTKSLRNIIFKNWMSFENIKRCDDGNCEFEGISSIHYNEFVDKVIEDFEKKNQNKIVFQEIVLDHYQIEDIKPPKTRKAFEFTKQVFGMKECLAEEVFTAFGDQLFLIFEGCKKIYISEDIGYSNITIQKHSKAFVVWND